MSHCTSILPKQGLGRGTTRRVVEGSPRSGGCTAAPSTMLRMVPLPDLRSGRITW